MQFEDWFKATRATLECEWLDTIPPEDVPLDDDTTDFFEEHHDEFMAYCKKEYCKWRSIND